jgi:hypothetical protein
MHKAPSTNYTLYPHKNSVSPLGRTRSFVAVNGSIGNRPSRHVWMFNITEQRILQQMVEKATEIVLHGNHDFDAFRDGSRVFNQVATSSLVQSQDGTEFSWSSFSSP